MVTMIGILILSFHVYYSKQLNQLSRSIKIDTWRCLTTRKHPLSIEQASSIHPEVKDLLNKAVGNYIKQKERQKMKPITSDCETSLRRENEELCIQCSLSTTNLDITNKLYNELFSVVPFLNIKKTLI